MNDIVITPENIDRIRISYKPNSSAPFAIRNFASISVITTGGQVVQISLQEMQTYIKMLQLKANIANDGTTVIATQLEPTGTAPNIINSDVATEILLGDPELTPVNVTVTFSLDDNPFDGSNNLSNNNSNGAVINAFTYRVNFAGAAAEFDLPAITHGLPNVSFEDEYTFSVTGGYIFPISNNGTSWHCIFIARQSCINQNIAFTSNAVGAVILTINTPTGLHDTDFTPSNGNILPAVGNTLQWVQNEGTVIFSLPKINGDFFVNDYSFSASGADVFIYATDGGANWNVFLTVSSDPRLNTLVTLTAKSFNANVFLENSNNNSGTVLNSLALDTNVITPLNETGFVGNFGFDVAATPLQVNQFACGRSFIKQTGVKTGTFNADFTASSDITGSIVAIGKSVIETPFDVPSTGNYSFPFNYEMTDEGFLTLILLFPNAGITPPPPVGVPVQAVAGNIGTSAALCPAPLVSYFTDDGTITTGKTVYTDVALTIPLAGNTFILSPDGNIYAIDNVTGVVGGVTGNSCAVPTTGKNMFVLSVAANQIDVDGTDYGAHSVGVNYNAVIKSNSIITNNSGGTRTFNFYKQAPFIPANLTSGSGSPVSVPNGNTYSLPNNIADYNYLQIS